MRSHMASLGSRSIDPTPTSRSSDVLWFTMLELNWGLSRR